MEPLELLAKLLRWPTRPVRSTGILGIGRGPSPSDRVHTVPLISAIRPSIVDAQTHQHRHSAFHHNPGYNSAERLNLTTAWPASRARASFDFGTTEIGTEQLPTFAHASWVFNVQSYLEGFKYWIRLITT